MLKGYNSSLPWRDPNGKLTDQSWSCTSCNNISMFSVNFLLKQTIEFEFEFENNKKNQKFCLTKINLIFVSNKFCTHIERSGYEAINFFYCAVAYILTQLRNCVLYHYPSGSGWWRLRSEHPYWWHIRAPRLLLTARAAGSRWVCPAKWWAGLSVCCIKMKLKASAGWYYE